MPDAATLWDHSPRPLDRSTLDHLFHREHRGLRRLAGRLLSREPFTLLTPDDLVSDAWLRLSSAHGLHAECGLHFRRLVAVAMRRVLLDDARRRRAARRNEGAYRPTDHLRTSPSDSAPQEARDLLERLAIVHPRPSRVVALRHLAGYDVGETARALAVSRTTVERDSRVARNWLEELLRTS